MEMTASQQTTESWSELMEHFTGYSCAALCWSNTQHYEEIN